MYYVYMLRCIDNSIYTGITTNIERRLEEHFNKTEKCAKYTMHHNIKYLEALWSTEDRKLASKLEFYIKGLAKLKKEELINNDNLKEIFKDKIDGEKYARENINKYKKIIENK